MNQEDKDKVMYTNADKFINLANELSKTDEAGSVGAAIRFAAARYSAFQASLRTSNLAEDRDEQLQLFSNEFTNMLQMNIDTYIKHQSQK